MKFTEYKNIQRDIKDRVMHIYNLYAREVQYNNRTFFSEFDIMGEGEELLLIVAEPREDDCYGVKLVLPISVIGDEVSDDELIRLFENTGFKEQILKNRISDMRSKLYTKFGDWRNADMNVINAILPVGVTVDRDCKKYEDKWGIVNRIPETLEGYTKLLETAVEKWSNGDD